MKKKKKKKRRCGLVLCRRDSGNDGEEIPIIACDGGRPIRCYGSMFQDCREELPLAEILWSYKEGCSYIACRRVDDDGDACDVIACGRNQ